MTQSPARLNAEARELIDAPNLAHFATVMRDGAPHVVAVWIAREANRLYCVKVEGSLALLNVRHDPRVSLSIVDRNDPYRTLHIRGTVSAIDRGDEATRRLHSLARRYIGTDFPSPVPDVAALTVEVRRAIFTYASPGT